MSGTAYLLLDVAGTPCALPRTAASEVLPLPDLYGAPTAAGWVAGLIDLGGRPVPVIDLAALLDLRAGGSEPGAYAHLVLTRDGDLAYLVDRVADLVSVPDAAVRALPPGESLNGCVAAEIALDGRLVHALDPGRLLTVRERARVEAMARAEGLRLAALPVPA